MLQVIPDSQPGPVPAGALRKATVELMLGKARVKALNLRKELAKAEATVMALEQALGVPHE